MANYFYTDEDGQKQGPVDGQQLAKLVMEGVVKPTAPIEHADTGWKGQAKEVHDFFAHELSESKIADGSQSPVFFDIRFTRFVMNFASLPKSMGKIWFR